MDEKREMNFLDEVEEEKKGGRIWPTVLFALCIAVLGILFTLWWGKRGVVPAAPKETGDWKAVETATQYTEVIDLAERFSIMAFNLSYTDVDHQADKVSGLMADNLMSLYSEAFLDPKWVEFLRESKAYVIYQRVDRATLINADGTHYWVRVIGKSIFNSDNTNPPSQMELPMSLVVVVKIDNGSMQISNFQEF